MADSNVQALRNVPMWGKYIFDAFQRVQKQLNNLSTQNNSSLTGSQNLAPPPIQGVTVKASGGIAHVQVTDNSTNLYRGLNYFAEYSTDSAFTAPVTHPMGPSRDARIPVGNEPLYYRAYSGYPTSPPSAPLYHGGSIPIKVTAIGSTPPPVPPGMGSGTGYPGQISGHGPIPWRGKMPPKR
jgi:hypothetical protein